MLNNILKSGIAVTVLLTLFACHQRESITFLETHLTNNKETFIEVIIPKANGTSKTAQNINKTLTHFACQVLNIDSAKNQKESISESAEIFNNAYILFKHKFSKQFEGNLPKWEALIDGSISYQNKAIVSIAINGSINTGAPSSRLKFKFFNFDLANGNALTTKQLIKDIPAFKGIAKRYFNKELLTNFTGTNNNSATFKLPENIGFNDNGVILVYDNLELGNFNKNVIEFTIPYTIADPYLNY